MGWAGAVVVGSTGAVVVGCVVVELVVEDVLADEVVADVEVLVDVDVEDCVASAVTRVGVAFFQSSMLVESESTDMTDSPDALAIAIAWLFG